MHRKEIKRLAKSKVTARLGAVMGTWFAWLGIELAAILIAAVISLFVFAGPTMLWAARSFSVLGIMIIGPALIMMECGFWRFCSFRFHWHRFWQALCGSAAISSVESLLRQPCCLRAFARAAGLEAP